MRLLNGTDDNGDVPDMVMPDSVQLESFAAGVETAVDVAQIQRQLNELWQLAAQSKGEATGQTITRACLFNLIAVSATETERDHLTETITTLTSRDPCRAIVLLAQPEIAQAELSASITAHCHLAGGGKQVCCEQINIHASGASVAHMASAVLPLLESDLPTIVWWPGNFLLQPDFFGRLLAVADRIIIDTSTWSQPEGQVAALAHVIVTDHRCIFSDLSWTRLALWRKLAAEFFDDAIWLAELSRLNSIHVAYGDGVGARWRGLLMASWIAAQLEWSPATAANKIQLQHRADLEATTVGMLSIELRSDTTTFTITKNHGEATACTTVATAQSCGLPRKRAFWPTDDASLLSQELDQSARRKVYERALTMAAALAKLL